MADLNLDNFKYILPESRIARFPVKKRDHSKLLFYNKGKISHHRFIDITSLLPDESLLVFNETRVIPARLIFHKKTGAAIEIMLLNPVAPSHDLNISLAVTGEVIWECMIKNLRKWKPESTLEEKLIHKNGQFILKARLVDRGKKYVQFTWDLDKMTFAKILALYGNVPLPPYLKREPVPDDKSRYQTVYSKNNGAVAAPTAGLHFTKKILKDIADSNHATDYITLHVSAGTFQPIQEQDILKHNMHTENIIVRKSNVRNIINNLGNIVAVGTTSMRTLESIYWYGVKLLHGKGDCFFIEKLFPYKQADKNLPGIKETLHAVINYMDEQNLEEIRGETQIFIFPGYDFKLSNGLITNYHVPGSTLMLLVAAFVGEDWKKIYDAALASDYRFLSYGDSSLLIPNPIK